MLRVVAFAALLGFAALYWAWPNDLVPDAGHYGRTDDVAVAFASAFAAVRIVRYRPRSGTGARPPGGRALGVQQLDDIAETIAVHGPPIILYNASHSGSRLLTRILAEMGVFMGAHLNDSEDSLDMAELVEHVVLEHAPDFSRLFADGDLVLEALALNAVEQHLQGRPRGARWGWKLCETGHVLPVIARLFPSALVIHLIRDGRDVAFSPFVAPKHRYWRKIYFSAGELKSWRGLPMTQRAYRSNGALFNAARWVNSVTLGRGHGLMLGERYLEVRYEELVAQPDVVARRLAAFLGLPAPGLHPDALAIDIGRVGKWRTAPPSTLTEVLQLLEPTLSQFGYGEAGDPAPADEGDGQVSGGPTR
jgi:hypothetical protein